MMRKVSDILRAAKARISDPANWIKGLDQDGSQFCARGAARVEFTPKRQGERVSVPCAEVLLSEVTYAKFDISIAEYNDHTDTTHADIMAVFDEAIALAESREQ